ncbi:hypothetical protein DFH07DRAFT_943415 [Mycena maculata]|uniref:Aminoglycoside phosphotransferase domain-containing protein n=1 Tax=Mycena maculata TaxID=230809 RepID=A0AAD7IFL7_9AGAR|nr:hypothetical protein DFH07DRAFT_943415 [Mycena maculata]
MRHLSESSAAGRAKRGTRVFITAFGYHNRATATTPPQDLVEQFGLLHVYCTEIKRVIATFNLEALQAQALTQATRSMEKLCTGCSPDGLDIIARLSGSATGQDEQFPVEALAQRFISEASPVVTLRYVKKHTSIPVPEVYYADSDCNNPVVLTALAIDFSELGLLVNHEDEWKQQRTKWEVHNGGLDDLPRAYAIRWFRLLDGINSLPPALLDPPDNTFVLFHDDFNTGNILVSRNDPTEVVAIASQTDIEDPEEYASLTSLQNGILQDAQLYMGYFSFILHSKRAGLDGLFLQWFDGVRATGRGQHIESFLGLKDFIAVWVI